MIKVALIIDEFFGGAGTAFGGYGFLARKHIARYIPNDEIHLDVILGDSDDDSEPRHEIVDGIDLFWLPKNDTLAKAWLNTQNYDIYLSIELTFDRVLCLEEDNPHKKLILWIQDPRPWYEWREISTVKLFPEPCYYKQSLYDTVNRWYQAGRVRFISQGYFLNDKAKDLYRLPNDTAIQYLPNPMEYKEVDLQSKKNNIVFLGRLECVKRGWLFGEIAKLCPEYEFHMLGQTFRQADSNSKLLEQYRDIPNLHFEGHVDGEQKDSFLREAKILVNTSIHEALPISFLEALAYGISLVSNQNPENLTSRFGIWTGQISGDGFDKVPLFVEAIRTLMSDDERRLALAKQGLEYVRRVHSVDKFTHDLRKKIRTEIAGSEDIKVSIVVPVYDVEPYIDQCLTSLENQTLREIEIIVINDASPGNEETIIQRHAAQDPRIRYYRNEYNRGLGATRNIGFSHARGVYLGCVDADDYCAPDMFEKLYDAATKHGADMSICTLYTVEQTAEDSTPRVSEKRYTAAAALGMVGHAHNHKELQSCFFDFYTGACLRLYKASFFRKYITYPENIKHGDIVAHFTGFLKAESVVLVNEPLYFYRINSPDSIIPTRTDVWAIRSFIEQVLELFRSEDLFETYRVRLSAFLMQMFFSYPQNKQLYRFIRKQLKQTPLSPADLDSIPWLSKEIQRFRRYPYSLYKLLPHSPKVFFLIYDHPLCLFARSTIAEAYPVSSKS